MYGIHVHEAVLEAGEHKTGATVHVVTERYDEGPHIAQHEISVMPGDTAETLQQRVLKIEHELYVETVRKIAAREIALPIVGN